MKNNYYIYLHIKLSTGEPFYVGKGKDNRAFVKRNRSIHWRNIVNKYDYDIIFIKEDLTEDEAFIQELYWINRIGRKDINKGPLVNFTDGGEGSSGRPMNDNTKEILLKINTGRTTSVKQKEIVGSRYKNKFGSEHNRSKKVICLETGEQFASMSEAERFYNMSQSSVSWSIKHKKPIFGKHFEIAE
jgi:hypothetical protein